MAKENKGKGRRSFNKAIFFVTFSDDAAEVRYVPTEEVFDGEVAYDKLEKVVSALADRINDDDDPKAKFFQQKGIMPAIRQLFTDAEAGETVLVSLNEDDYQPVAKTRGPKAKNVTTDEDVLAAE